MQDRTGEFPFPHFTLLAWRYTLLELCPTILLNLDKSSLADSLRRLGVLSMVGFGLVFVPGLPALLIRLVCGASRDIESDSGVVCAQRRGGEGD